MKSSRPRIILALVISGVCGYYSCGRDTVQPVVDHAIYRSGQLDGRQLEKAIKTYGLKTIFNLRGTNEGAEWYNTEKQIAESYGVSLHDFPFNASTLPDVLPLLELLDRLETVRTPLLVHCQHGADRTSFVSTLILALQNDVPYTTAMRQISWKFGVFPGRKSAGPLFFDQYESWLRDAGIEHSPGILRSWIRQDYIDGNGSIEYSIDTVEGKELSRNYSGDNRSITIESGFSRLTIVGWAYDRRHEKRIVDMTVGLNEAIFAKAVFSHPRPDVARYLNLPGNNNGNQPAPLGWSARFDGTSLAPGTYDITLHLDTPSGSTVTVPTRCVIKIK